MHPSAATDLAGEDALRHVASLVQSLLSYSHSSKFFPGRWQSIRCKLDHLASVLSSATAASAASSTSIGNLLLQELLQDIAVTVADTHELARVCSHPSSFPGGRLLLLSNLDLAIAKLGIQSRSVEGLYSSGILIHSDTASAATVVASGPADICRRLRIGNRDVKLVALTAINDLLRGGERVAAAETPEVISLLVSSLEIREARVQEEAAEAISLLAGYESVKSSLSAAGAIPALLQVESELAKERSARALKKLTEHSSNAWLVSANDGAITLLDIVNGDGPAELLGSACGVLKNLSAVPEIRAYVIERNIVPALMRHVTFGEDAVRVHAIDLLMGITSEDEAAKAEAVGEGLVESLVRVLDPTRGSSDKTREAALRAIEGLCTASVSGQLMGCGFVERVLPLLRSGEVSVQESALKAASRFLGVSEEARKAMGDAGFMPELLNLLEAQSQGVREMAANALSRMVSVQRNQRRFAEDGESVAKILEVLVNRSEEKPLTTKFLLSALASLSDTNVGRRKIAASGYVSGLQQLADADGEGGGGGDGEARRIVRKVTGGRLKSLLHGLWGS